MTRSSVASPVASTRRRKKLGIFIQSKRTRTPASASTSIQASDSTSIPAPVPAPTGNRHRHPVSAKCVLIGDSNVGKTSLIHSFLTGHFIESHEPTIGGHFRAKTLNEPPVALQVWDTFGMEKYRCMLPSYMNGAICVMLVFDLTNNKSLTSARDFWMDFIEETRTEDRIIPVMIGNKSDLVKERTVSRMDAKALADHYNMMYLETSAKTSENVQDLFHRAAKGIFDAGLGSIKETKKKSSIFVTLTPEVQPQEKNKSKCCA